MIRHGYGERPDRRIELELELDESGLRITICHEGNQFDPGAYSAPDLDHPAEGGYGLHLMHELMDAVVHDRGERGQARLVLVKRRGAA